MCKNSQQHGSDWQYLPVSKHWHWQLQHQIWRRLPTEAWTACSSFHIRWWNAGRVFSFWQGAGDGEHPRSILADRASHIIPPTHHIASRHQIHQDAEPNWQWQQHNLPHTEYRALITSRKGNRSLSEETDKSEKWGDALEWYTPLSESLEFRHYKAHAQGINNISTVATLAWEAKGWSLFEGVIYKIFTIWLSKHIPKQCSPVIPLHFVSV